MTQHVHTYQATVYHQKSGRAVRRVQTDSLNECKEIHGDTPEGHKTVIGEWDAEAQSGSYHERHIRGLYSPMKGYGHVFIDGVQR